MVIDNFSIARELEQSAGTVDMEVLKQKILQPQQDYIRILRENNPFYVPVAQAPETNTESPQAQVPVKPPVRFIYKGNAVLKSKEVAVVEDALNQETLFLSKGESIGGYVLINFTPDFAILRSQEGEELIINREEDDDL